MTNAPDAAAPESATRPTFVSRFLYWLPVLAVLVLFGQVALLGLRPALSERARLAQAEVVLNERHQRDLLLSQEIAAHLAARYDPVFIERQRRSRQLTAALTAPAIATPAITD